MRLTVTEMESPRGLRLSGELDMSTARELSRSLDPRLEDGGDVTLDMAGLTFMDSTGLQVLIRSALMIDGKGRLILQSPTTIVRSILELAIRTDKLANLVVQD
jgi:anti-anti-sigma factor